MPKFPDTKLSRWERIQLEHTRKGSSSKHWQAPSIKTYQPDALAWRLMVELTIDTLNAAIQNKQQLDAHTIRQMVDKLLAVWPEEDAKTYGLWILDQYKAAMEYGRRHEPPEGGFNFTLYRMN